MAAALKNIGGVIYDKNSLPHRKIGSVEEGGDAYKKKNIYISICFYYICNLFSVISFVLEVMG